MRFGLIGLGAFSFLALGCTGIDPAMIGVGVNAVQQGVTYVSGVDSYSFQPARYEDSLSAALRAGESIGLDMYSVREVSEGHTEIRFLYDEDDRLTVQVEHQTNEVTLIQVNIKKKSRRGMGTLYMRALTDELRKAEAYVGEWQDNTDLIGN